MFISSTNGAMVAPTNSVVVTNLTPLSSYTFRMRAENDLGKSDYSKEVTIVTTIEGMLQLLVSSRFPYATLPPEHIVHSSSFIQYAWKLTCLLLPNLTRIHFVFLLSLSFPFPLSLCHLHLYFILISLHLSLSFFLSLYHFLFLFQLLNSCLKTSPVCLSTQRLLKSLGLFLTLSRKHLWKDFTLDIRWPRQLIHLLTKPCTSY